MIIKRKKIKSSIFFDILIKLNRIILLSLINKSKQKK